MGTDTICSEALTFYEKALDGQDKRIMYYKDAPPNPDFLINALSPSVRPPGKNAVFLSMLPGVFGTFTR